MSTYNQHDNFKNKEVFREIYPQELQSGDLFFFIPYKSGKEVIMGVFLQMYDMIPNFNKYPTSSFWSFVVAYHCEFFDYSNYERYIRIQSRFSFKKSFLRYNLRSKLYVYNIDKENNI